VNREKYREICKKKRIDFNEFSAKSPVSGKFKHFLRISFKKDEQNSITFKESADHVIKHYYFYHNYLEYTVCIFYSFDLPYGHAIEL
jgi:hypothetical protein